ncbi:MAG TPA: response regulator transcription factor [Balneolales bacterium]|nr:response regulator transcription factor [Balneolales bacterium]
MIEVMIADDFPLVREGVREILLHSSLDVRVVAEAGNAAEVMQQLSQHTGLDLLILDLSMPGNSGLQTLITITKKYPKLAILVLSIHQEEDFAPITLEKGASGYVMKSSVPEELVTAVRQIVLDNKKYVSPKLARFLAQKLNKKDKRSFLSRLLTTREYHVMCMLATGRNIINVAKELGIGVKTVRLYQSRIMEKMGWECVTDFSDVYSSVENFEI